MNAFLLLNYVAVESSSAGVVVTRGMLRVRAVELASIAGRAPTETSKADWEEAKRQLMENILVRGAANRLSIAK